MDRLVPFIRSLTPMVFVASIACAADGDGGEEPTTEVEDCLTGCDETFESCGDECAEDAQIICLDHCTADRSLCLNTHCRSFADGSEELARCTNACTTIETACFETCPQVPDCADSCRANFDSCTLDCRSFPDGSPALADCTVACAEAKSSCFGICPTDDTCDRECTTEDNFCRGDCRDSAVTSKSILHSEAIS